jgi:hypothetical protein
LGSAAAARVAVTQLIWPLLGLSVAFLAYAHYRVWIQKRGHRTGKIILVINTVLVVLLWAWRLPF